MIKVSDLDELGRKVRQLRTGRGMTQAALAKAAGTHQSAIAMMEKGSRRPPGRELIEKLAVALDCKSELIFATMSADQRRGRPSERKADQAKIGRRFRVQRESFNLTQAELARRMDVDWQAISAIERGVRPPTQNLALGVARVLNCDLDSLVPGIVSGASVEPPIVIVRSPDPAILVGRTADDLAGLEALGFTLGVHDALVSSLVDAAKRENRGLSIRYDLPSSSPWTLDSTDDGTGDGLGPRFRAAMFKWVAGYCRDDVSESAANVFAAHIGGAPFGEVARSCGVTPKSAKSLHYLTRDKYREAIQSPVGIDIAAGVVRSLVGKKTAKNRSVNHG